MSIYLEFYLVNKQNHSKLCSFVIIFVQYNLRDIQHLRLCICPTQLIFDLTLSVISNSCVANSVKTHMIVLCLASLTNTHVERFFSSFL